jgi:site-specific DNA-methyltransferase (adenine-specific)
MIPARKSEPWNRVIQGDSLRVMKRLPEKSIQLIYMDPPFFTGRIFEGGEHHFGDRWSGGMESYLDWLRPRFLEMKRLLTSTGSLLVHLDWHAVHYARVELDQIFGMDSFQNEIIWHYQTGGASKVRFSRKHDNILWYTRSGDDWKFHGERIRIPRTEKSLHRARNPKGARIASSDQWKNPQDVLTIPQMNPMSKERTGYPTQKPEELLRVFVEAFTDPGDVVGDFFCGSGTTPTVAHQLNRRWIASDVSKSAVALSRKRASHP